MFVYIIYKMEDQLVLLKQGYEEDLSKRLSEQKESMSVKSWGNYVDKKFEDVKARYIKIIEHSEKFEKEYVEEPEINKEEPTE